MSTDQTIEKIGKGITASPAAIEGAKKAHVAGIKAPPQPPEAPADVSGKRLKSFIERIERLNAEQDTLAEDIKEVFAESKGVGFDPKIMRKLIRLRAMDSQTRREESELLDLYSSAVGLE